MLAYHFLKVDMRAGEGQEPAWTVGEERTWAGPLILCYRGLHYAPSWLDALNYAPGPMACLVDVDEMPGVAAGEDKGVSRRRKLLAARDVTRELRTFACDCAERALQRERDAGREPDPRSWNAVSVARRHVVGEATDTELDAASAAAWDAARDARASAAAWDAARAAAWDAAWAAAWAARAAASAAAWDAARDARASAAAWDAARAAAWDAAWAAARAAAWDAARAAEIARQRERLAELLDPLFAGVEV